ncbi:hypothetical protein TcCL_Unassigned05062, partial [Trypanosoma cruzi]
EAASSTLLRKKLPCAQHTGSRNKKNGAHPSPRHSRPRLRPHRLASCRTAGCNGWCPAHTTRHAAHTVPSLCRRGRRPSRTPRRSRPIAEGNTNNRRCGQSVPIAGKKRRRNGGMSAAQPAEGHSTGHGNTKWQWCTAQTETSRSTLL